MKKLILMTCLITGTIFGAQAQKHKKGVGKLPKTLTAQLKLTADQQAKTDAILATKAKRIGSLITAAKDDKRAIKKGKKHINAESEAQMNKLLTTDQKKIYAQFEDAKKARNKARAALNDTTGTPPLKQ